MKFTDDKGQDTRSLAHPGRQNFFRAVVCLIVMALLSACGGASETIDSNQTTDQAQSNANGGKTDACSMLTDEEARAILGEPIAAPKIQVVSEATEKTAAVLQCTFTAAEAPAKSFTILMRRSHLKDNDPAATHKTLAEANIPTKEVSGVGDAACGSNQLHAFKDGNLYLVTSIFGMADKAEALEKAKTVAQKAFARL